MENLEIIKIEKQNNNFTNVVVRYNGLIYKFRGIQGKNYAITEQEGLLTLDNTLLSKLGYFIGLELNKPAKEVTLLTKEEVTNNNDVVYSQLTENYNNLEACLGELENSNLDTNINDYQLALFFNGIQQLDEAKNNVIYKQLEAMNKGIFFCPFANQYLIKIVDC